MNPFKQAWLLLKNAADYDVDMNDPVGIESWNEPMTMCSKCGQYGANLRMTYNNKFGSDEREKYYCQTCYQGSRGGE
jgi:hypothetical protein